MIISVVMAMYNGERYIEEQVLSIFNQTVPIDELIICDDASTDKCVKIVRDIISIYGYNIHIHINKTRKGYAGNFKNAIDLAIGDVIFLSDQDDIWEKDKVQVCLDYMERYNQILSLSSGFTFFKNDTRHHFKGVKIFRKPQKVTLEKFLRHPRYPGMSMVFRKALWDYIISQRIDWDRVGSHDWIINFFAIRLRGMYSIKEKLVRYRIHDNNTEGVLFGGSKKNPLKKRIGLIKGIIDNMQVVSSIVECHELVESLKFQKKRIQIIRKTNIIKLFFFESRNLLCISWRSILGDVYACCRG